jgi:hypothetical protein
MVPGGRTNGCKKGCRALNEHLDERERKGTTPYMYTIYGDIMHLSVPNEGGHIILPRRLPDITIAILSTCSNRFA